MAATADIVLATLNAKYIHAAFGLRYLFANLGELRPRAHLAEFDINQRPIEIVERLLALDPRIIGFGVYIWNTALTTEVIALLKRLRPGLVVVLGGPEVSFETEQQAVTQLADFIITGEADLAFATVCRQVLSGTPPPARIIAAPLPEFSQLTLPYEAYTADDIAHRIIYVEASRGCPYTCEFCLSSLDVPVRAVPLDPFLAAMQRLLDRGVRQFKFVDRTFNLNLATSRAILDFFHERYRAGLFLHFEMIPDRLPEALREPIAKFPPGALQFEVGVQTFDEATARHISRRQNYEKLADNFRFLRAHTGVHIHADLIVGLPGESVERFAAGFDRLVALDPQEIQVGILKRLRGTPIVRHDAEWQMVYSPVPPYEILQNKLISFATMQRLRRFARYWDLAGNSGNFIETTPLLWLGDGDGERSPADSKTTADGNGTLSSAAVSESVGEIQAHSPFSSFLRFSDWLHERTCATSGIALDRLAGLLFEFLTRERGLEARGVAEALRRDFERAGRHRIPTFLVDRLPAPAGPRDRIRPGVALPKRQTRHSPRAAQTTG